MKRVCTTKLKSGLDDVIGGWTETKVRTEGRQVRMSLRSFSRSFRC